MSSRSYGWGRALWSSGIRRTTPSWRGSRSGRSCTPTSSSMTSPSGTVRSWSTTWRIAEAAVRVHRRLGSAPPPGRSGGQAEDHHVADHGHGESHRHQHRTDVQVVLEEAGPVEAGEDDCRQSRGGQPDGGPASGTHRMDHQLHAPQEQHDADDHVDDEQRQPAGEAPEDAAEGAAQVWTTAGPRVMGWDGHVKVD